MSYTQLKRVAPDGTVKSVREFRNSHGWSAFIYSKLTAKYRLGDSEHSWVMDDEVSDRLWKLVDNPNLEPCERVALAMTFDRAWAAAEDVPRVAVALREFSKLHPAGDNVCHLLDIADAIDGDDWSSEDGVAFYGMSVAEDLWIVQGECPTCEQPIDEFRPFNVKTDAGAARLDLDALEQCREGEKFLESEAASA